MVTRRMTKGKVVPESGGGENLVTVRCPNCGNLLAHIDLNKDEGPVRRRLFCKKCRNTLLVLVNPTLVQHVT